MNRPASRTELEAAERAVALRLPDDLRAFYLTSDGGEAWFEEHHEEPGFFLQVHPLSDVVGIAGAMAQFDFWSDTVTFGGDGSRESFCLRRDDLSLWMVDPTAPPADRIACGSSFSELVRRISEGWNPFEGV